MQTQKPAIHPEAHVFRGAVLTGATSLAAGAAVWHNAVLRGDLGPIRVGENSNIQDGSVVHNDSGGQTVVGRGVTVGHLCLLHGCTIGDDSLIGMGSILMNDVKVGRGCIIGAGSLLTQGTEVPDGMLAMGRPAKVIRPLTEAELEGNRASAQHYVDMAREYSDE